jgi:hypothetical protein
MNSVRDRLPHCQNVGVILREIRSARSIGCPVTVIGLSGRSLRKVESSQVQKTFTFVVGNETHQCHWFVAEMLSPHISQLRQADSTVDSLSHPNS